MSLNASLCVLKVVFAFLELCSYMLPALSCLVLFHNDLLLDLVGILRAGLCCSNPLESAWTAVGRFGKCTRWCALASPLPLPLDLFDVSSRSGGVGNGFRYRHARFRHVCDTETLERIGRVEFGGEENYRQVGRVGTVEGLSCWDQ